MAFLVDQMEEGEVDLSALLQLTEVVLELLLLDRDQEAWLLAMLPKLMAN